MPHRRSRAKKPGSTVIGGAALGTISTGIDESIHSSQENEMITRAARSAATVHYHPSQSNGSHAEVATCAG
jgi:hypothetical protein